MPWDGHSTGEIEVRGPWIAAGYFREPDGGEKFDAGWLRTGDIASVDEQAFVQITDRSKDVIKSGGEWISSVELENELMSHPDVVEAAVIAKPDERWAERPLCCVVLREQAADDAGGAGRAPAAARVAKLWLPDEFAFVEEIPEDQRRASSTRRCCAGSSPRTAWRGGSRSPEPRFEAAFWAVNSPDAVMSTAQE